MVATMPKPPSKRNDVPVKIDAYALKLARIAAAHDDKLIAEVVSEVVIECLEERLKDRGVPLPERSPTIKKKRD